MVGPAYLSSTTNSEEILVYAVLDNGSNSTYIAKSVADRIRSFSVRKQITITTFNVQETTSLNKYKILVLASKKQWTKRTIWKRMNRIASLATGLRYQPQGLPVPCNSTTKLHR